jgi:hypothetical protein
MDPNKGTNGSSGGGKPVRSPYAQPPSDTGSKKSVESRMSSTKKNEGSGALWGFNHFKETPRSAYQENFKDPKASTNGNRAHESMHNSIE